MAARFKDCGILEQWTEEQTSLRAKIIQDDVCEWQRTRSLQFVGGLDISFVKDSNIACGALVVCKLPDLEVVYEDFKEVELTAPYIPGFLAFREVQPCLSLLEKLKSSNPELFPQVILLDGNGTLHPRGCGLASHFGVLANICTIGVAKNLYQWDDLQRDKTRFDVLQNPGDFYYLKQLENIVGMALKTTENARNPVYISVGHKISLQTARWTVMECITKFRVPEPIRQADIRSRQLLRAKYPGLVLQA